MPLRCALSSRTGEVVRKSKETQLTARVALDGRGRVNVATGLAFLDHMLEQVARYVGFGATIHVDVIRGRNRHHIAEATFKALGLALRQAMTVGGGPGVPSSKGLLG